MRLPPIKIPPLTHFLPLLVGVMCFGLFAMAGLMLITPHLEPSPRGPAGNPIALSAQGFKGLRDVLKADGYPVTLNRQETGPQAVSDLAIVTLDSDAAIYNSDREYVEGEEKPKKIQSISSSSSSSTSSVSASQASSSSFDTASASKAAQEDYKREMAEASASKASQDASSTSAQAADPAKTEKDEDVYATPSAEKGKRLLYAPVGRAVLVVAPKWDANPMTRHPRWAADPFLKHSGDIFTQLTLLSPIHSTCIRVEGDCAYRITYKRLDYRVTRAPAAKPRSYALVPAAGQSVITRGYTSGRIRGLQSITGPNLTPLLLGPNGEVLLSRVNPMPGDKPFKAPVYLLSDPDLLNNQILADPERVAGALSLIDSVAPKTKTKPSVVFDVTFNSLAYEQDFMHHVARAPFVGIPLALIVMALALMWSAFSRFGPAHDPATDTPHGRGVVVLADNAARLIAKAGRQPKLAPAYAQMIRDQVLKATGLFQHTSAPDDMAERLSEKYNTLERFSALSAEAQKLTNPMQLLTWARRLHQWKSAIVRTEK
ncbi:hypothetical protein [Asticcacaulis sp. YBE204]|uniref:hypothetical protein n=1 Tax=Asticcacaulis sp. YBE204 TaxID=1282363 RepID=UPI0003C3BFAE|nr:hypothetical protein [Asticcacaulis sp. YBE204]ESQ78422.1 hypothetical protein AEYBE204_14720 [Asticcacaulis sp. YBE204]